MKKISIITLFSFLILLAGCNKDQEVAELENEIKNEASSESLANAVSEAQPDTAVEKYVMSPEQTPTEEPEAQITQPSPAPTTMPVRISAGGYTVQVSSSVSYEETQLLVEKFQKRGYEPFVVQSELNGHLYYRVRIGAFETWKQAKDLGLELKDKFSINYWIANN